MFLNAAIDSQPESSGPSYEEDDEYQDSDHSPPNDSNESITEDNDRDHTQETNNEIEQQSVELAPTLNEAESSANINTEVNITSRPNPRLPISREPYELRRKDSQPMLHRLFSRMTGENGSESDYAEALIVYGDEPQSYEEALSGQDAKNWSDSMNVEYNSLIDNKTWVLTELPSHKRLLIVAGFIRSKGEQMAQSNASSLDSLQKVSHRKLVSISRKRSHQL